MVLSNMKITLASIAKGWYAVPMGLGYLATYLRSKTPLREVEILDLQADTDIPTSTEIERFVDEVLNTHPDIIGLSSITIRYNSVVRLARLLKKRAEIPIIIGGVHISTCPESFDKTFDAGVIGEGEETLVELLQHYGHYQEFVPNRMANIRGLVFFCDGELVETAPRPLIEPLDTVGFIARELFNEKYFERASIWSMGGQEGKKGDVITSRGCPYRCVFCSSSAFWRKLRFHSAEYVVSDIKQLIMEHDVDVIDIWDDLFTVNKARLKAIVSGLEREGLIGKAQFFVNSKVNLIDDELCSILRKMGVATVSFGFESGSNKVLGYLKKGTATVEQAKRAVLLCRQYGFNVFGCFMYGSPGETIEDMEKTLDLLDFMREAGVAKVWHFVTAPLPGTELWGYAVKQGLIGEDYNWDRSCYKGIDEPIFLHSSVGLGEFWRIFYEAKRRLPE